MITPDTSPIAAYMLDELTTEDFLQVVGQRVRQQRARKAMSRKRLAEVSTVSERYLAQLESGQGNMSIVLLRKVTAAIGLSMATLMSEEVSQACIGKLSIAAQDSFKAAQEQESVVASISTEDSALEHSNGAVPSPAPAQPSRDKQEPEVASQPVLAKSPLETV